MSCAGSWTFMPVRGGAFTLIDSDVYEKVKHRSWTTMRKPWGNYIQSSTAEHPRLLHRLVLGLMRGDGRVTDHINRDPSDNRRVNLRIVTQGQNLQNKAAYAGARSRFRGVTADPKRPGKWRARVRLNTKEHFLGRFDSEEQAAEAAVAFRREHMPYSTMDQEGELS